eukprot:GEMP01021332.1.p1 GENE.GEMP01021332.1~~GEMP01021332.1.p1  ORF type:complete len:571 (+),score=107.77 GEMP01021332.1:92-1804(+)
MAMLPVFVHGFRRSPAILPRGCTQHHTHMRPFRAAWRNFAGRNCAMSCTAPAYAQHKRLGCPIYLCVRPFRGPGARLLGMRPHRPWPSYSPLHFPATLSPSASSSSSSSNTRAYSSDTSTTGKLQRFIRMIDDPDIVEMSSRDAQRKFGVSEADLSNLRQFTKENPFHVQGERVTMYWVPDVVKVALQKHGRNRLIQEYQAYLMSAMPQDVKSKIYGSSDDSWKLRRFYLQPSTSTPEGRVSLMTGLRVNCVIFSIKCVAWFVTNSQALFAEMMHSAADVANYTYRLLQLRRSEFAGDREHPYGYAPLRYITADRSFTLLAMLGSLVPAQQAMRVLWIHQACNMDFREACTAITILACSMGLESIALRTSWREITEAAKVSRHSAITQLREGRDVMTVATFCEAVCGVVGGAVGIVGVWTTYCYQLAAFDATASLIMSGLVGMTACFLLNKSQRALLGQTLPETLVLRLIDVVLADPVVNDVQDVKTEVVGTTTVRFKAEVSFNAEEITRKSKRRQAPAFPVSDAEFADWLEQNNADFLRALTEELKRVERIIRLELKIFPNVHVDLEPA